MPPLRRLAWHGQIGRAKRKVDSRCNRKQLSVIRSNAWTGPRVIGPAAHALGPRRREAITEKPLEIQEIAPCCPDRISPLQPAHSLTPDPPEDVAREMRRRQAGLLQGITDTHVHLFPPAIYQALWRWFDAHAWHIAFRGDAEATLAHLSASGTQRVMGLVYAHRPGIAQLLNPFMAELVRAHPQVVGLGTGLPGEPNAADIVKEAIDVHKLRGIKLHCHVQKVAIDSPQVLEVLEICQQRQVPAIVHAGREPASRAYGVQTHEICGVDRTRRVLQRLPGLRLLIPHLGADEFSDYFRLLADHEHLYLDTAMACADYFA